MASFDDFLNQLSAEDRAAFEQRIYNDVQAGLSAQRQQRSEKNKWFGARRLSNFMDTLIAVPETDLVGAKITARLRLADKINDLTDKQTGTLDKLSDMLD